MQTFGYPDHVIHALGYAGICLGLPGRSISRTVRVANATPARLREIINANLTDLAAILDYNTREKLCLFRMNQSIIPLASHPVNMLQWWTEEEFAPLLRALGTQIRAHGLRVSMHPGQYTVLNSQHAAVVAAAIADLTASCRVLDGMALDPAHKIVIHGGAGQPDRAVALARLEAIWPSVPEHVRTRLVLENDDRTFSVADLLPVCRQLAIPLVFDWLHHHAFPGPWAHRSVADIMADVAQTWRPRDGRPKVHFSSQDPDKRPGAHAYWLDPHEFLAFREAMSPVAVDVMAECKGKDLAVIRLRRDLGWDTQACA